MDEHKANYDGSYDGSLDLGSYAIVKMPRGESKMYEEYLLEFSLNEVELRNRLPLIKLFHKEKSIEIGKYIEKILVERLDLPDETPLPYKVTVFLVDGTELPVFDVYKN